MAKRLRKIAGTAGSDGLTSSPTVLEAEVDGVAQDELILVGRVLDGETRRMLDIPDGEDVVLMPRELYLRGARRLAEGG